MLTGAPPFAGATAQAVMARHMVETVPGIRTVRGTVPVPVEQALLRALAKVPADRYATAPEFATALTKATTAPLPPPRRHLRWPVAVALAGTALAAAAFWGSARASVTRRTGSRCSRSRTSRRTVPTPTWRRDSARRSRRAWVASRRSGWRAATRCSGSSEPIAAGPATGPRSRIRYLAEGSVRRGRHGAVAVRLIDASDDPAG
jgi:hypothetical protein